MKRYTVRLTYTFTVDAPDVVDVSAVRWGCNHAMRDCRDGRWPLHAEMAMLGTTESVNVAFKTALFSAITKEERGALTVQAITARNLEIDRLWSTVTVYPEDAGEPLVVLTCAKGEP